MARRNDSRLALNDRIGRAFDLQLPTADRMSRPTERKQHPLCHAERTLTKGSSCLTTRVEASIEMRDFISLSVSARMTDSSHPCRRLEPKIRGSSRENTMQSRNTKFNGVDASNDSSPKHCPVSHLRRRAWCCIVRSLAHCHIARSLDMKNSGLQSGHPLFPVRLSGAGPCRPFEPSYERLHY